MNVIKKVYSLFLFMLLIVFISSMTVFADEEANNEIKDEIKDTAEVAEENKSDEVEKEKNKVDESVDNEVDSSSLNSGFWNEGADINELATDVVNQLSTRINEIEVDPSIFEKIWTLIVEAFNDFINAIIVLIGNGITVEA